MRSFSIQHRKTEKFEVEPEYTGGTDHFIIYMLFQLMKEYNGRGNCSMVYKKGDIQNHFLIHYSMIEKKLYCSPLWTNNFNNLILNPGCQFIFLELVIIFPTAGLHSNILFIDKKNRTIQRYDPHGISSKTFKKDMIEMDRIISKYFIKEGIIDKYIPPSKYCIIGPQSAQTYDEDYKKYSRHGYCTMWSFWYLEMRLMYPEISLTELEDKINERFDHYESKGISRSKFIHNYTLYYIKKIENDFKMLYSDFEDLDEDEFNDRLFQFIKS